MHETSVLLGSGVGMKFCVGVALVNLAPQILGAKYMNDWCLWLKETAFSSVKLLSSVPIGDYDKKMTLMTRLQCT